MASTMIVVDIDRSDRVPLHDQVAAEIRRAIAEGEAGPGDRLPLAKDIAAVLGVNKNTVLRAMRILREEGLVGFGRGNGITVTGSVEKGAVLRQVRELMEFARRQGYKRDSVIAMIQSLP
jgi:GntR family transcriptional regulator